MKTIKVLALCMAFAGSVFPVFAERSASDTVADVYDLYSPEAKTNRIWVSIEGDIPSGRVSLVRSNKDPLKEKDAKGNPLIKPNEKYKTVYCRMNHYGAEDNRAFQLGAYAVLEGDEWVRVVISFSARRNGKVRLLLRPEYHPHFSMKEKDYENIYWGRFAKLESINAKFKDPNFTKAKNWGAERFWHFGDKIKSEVVAEEDAPTPKVLRVPMRVYQDITVKAGVPVTISFYARSDNAFPSKK